MSILLFAESENNKLKRNAAEIASYGAALAGELNKDCVAVSFNADNAQELGQFGVSKVFNVTNVPQQFDAHVYASVLTHYINSLGATHIILGSSADAKFLAPLVASQYKHCEYIIFHVCRLIIYAKILNFFENKAVSAVNQQFLFNVKALMF